MALNSEDQVINFKPLQPKLESKHSNEQLCVLSIYFGGPLNGSCDFHVLPFSM